MKVNISVKKNKTEENKDTHIIDRMIAEDIFRRALYYTPVVSGKLKNSLKIEVEDNRYVIICDSEYGAYVHECVGNVHNEPTRAKFIEDAAIEVWLSLQGCFDISIEYTPKVKLYINDVSKGSVLFRRVADV